MVNSPEIEPEDDDESLGLKKEKKKNVKKDIAIIVTAVVVLGVLTYVLKHYVDVDRFRAYLHPNGSFAQRMQSYLLYVFGMALLVALGAPRVLLCGLGGAVYGAALGIVLNTIGSVLGALGPYQIGKSVLRKTMKRRLGRHFETWKKRFQKRGFMWTLNLRLLPMANATLTGVICGACKVSVWDYVAATALGTIPQTVIFSMVGSGAAKGKYDQLLQAAAIFVAVALAQWLYIRRTRAKKEKCRMMNAK